MGLDMFLIGRKHKRLVYGDTPIEDQYTKEDGFPVTERRLEIGYWRKHPNLHGYIVNVFNEGDDDCQPLPLAAEDVRQIIAAVKAGELPHTEGFFFGKSEGTEEERQEDIAILERALEWVSANDPEDYRDLYYEASW